MGTVSLDVSPASVVAVCSACSWRAVETSRLAAHHVAARHALAHDDPDARKNRAQYLRRNGLRAC